VTNRVSAGGMWDGNRTAQIIQPYAASKQVVKSRHFELGPESAAIVQTMKLTQL